MIISLIFINSLVIYQAADQPTLSEEKYMLPQVVDSSKEQLSVRAVEDDDEKLLPSLDLSLKSDFEPMETTGSESVEEVKESFIPSPEISSVYPGYYQAFIPVPIPFWPSNMVLQGEDGVTKASEHQILKPTPVFPKEPVNVDELVGLSHLSIGDGAGRQVESSSLSLKLTGEPSSRQSAFHARNDNS